MNPNVDIYLTDGCGRCALYQTPACKVHTWQQELKQLRRVALDCDLEETYKWSQPCYTYQNSNVLLVTAFKDYATIAFFKGTLLEDTDGMLIAPGESSQAARQLRFTNVKDILAREATTKAYIHQAIEVEKAGLKVSFKSNPEPIPEELQKKLEHDASFKTAFEALTPGRQRGYIIYFSQPKQAATRNARIEKCISKILKGEGMQDGYKARKK